MNDCARLSEVSRPVYLSITVFISFGACGLWTVRGACRTHLLLPFHPRELGPPAYIMDGPVTTPTGSSPPRQPKEEGPIYGELVVLG